MLFCSLEILNHYCSVTGMEATLRNVELEHTLSRQRVRSFKDRFVAETLHKELYTSGDRVCLYMPLLR
jgi:hypothetical protein